MGVRQLVNEQAHANICSGHGHRWKFVLPLQTRDETCEVFCGCATCETRQWRTLPPEAYARVVGDAADGKMC